VIIGCTLLGMQMAIRGKKVLVGTRFAKTTITICSILSSRSCAQRPIKMIKRLQGTGQVPNHERLPPVVPVPYSWWSPVGMG
jgi:hypothetical protein